MRQGHEYARVATESFAHQRPRELAYLVHADGPRLPAHALHEQLLLAATDAKIHVAVSGRLAACLLHIPSLAAKYLINNPLKLLRRKRGGRTSGDRLIWRTFTGNQRAIEPKKISPICGLLRGMWTANGLAVPLKRPSARPERGEARLPGDIVFAGYDART